MSKKQYAHSYDGETFIGYHDSIDEAIMEASDHDGTIWVGTVVPPDPAVNFDLDSLIELINDNIAFEFTGLDVDDFDFIDVTDIDVFEAKIKSAIREHITPIVFAVENVKEIKSGNNEAES